MLDPAVEARLWPRIQQGDGCWEWSGAHAEGYAQISVSARLRRVHRLMYELLVGPVADGLTLDHTCRNRGCVNPSHLEPVTNRQNVLRGVGPTAVNARKTHCYKGHEFTPANTYRSKSGRECRICRAVSHARSGALRNRRLHTVPAPVPAP